MKKLLAIVLALAMVFSFAACGKEKVQEGMAPVDGITAPEFKIKLCGEKVDSSMMSSYPLYLAKTDTVNSQGTEKQAEYIGYKLTDMLKALNSESLSGKITATATDGYVLEYDGDMDQILIALIRDGEVFKDGPWFAPCDSKTSGDFLQDLKKLDIGEPIPADDKEDQAENVELTAPVAEDKTDKIKFADYSFKVNGTEVKNADLEGLKIWRITVTVQNSKGAVSEAKYSGYVLKDVLEKLGISNPASVKAVADDGYEAELTAEQLADELTIIAIEKDKATGENGTIWLAPCSSQTSGDYAKNVVEIVAK